MNFRLLRYFLAAASTLNFSRAAENLHVSQSTLSQQIQQLEEHYGVPLFDRIGRSVSLTAAGIELQEVASRMLLEEDHLQERLKALDHGTKTEAGSLCISFDSNMAHSLPVQRMVNVIRDLQQELQGRIVFHPQFLCTDFDDPTMELNTILSDPRPDLWLIGSESFLRYPELHFETMLALPFALRISKNHPLYREDLALEDLPYILNNTVLFMIQNRARHFRAALNQIPTDKPIDPVIRYERSADVISLYVNLGDGVSITPHDNQTLFVSDDCKSIPIPNSVFYVVVGHRPDTRNPLVPLLLEKLRTTMD